MNQVAKKVKKLYKSAASKFGKKRISKAVDSDVAKLQTNV